MGEAPIVLEGLFVAAAPGVSGGAVIAPPHPRYGGSMENPVVSELAWAATRAGLASLRFNWRGVGASSGEPTGEIGAGCADYGAALAQLAATVPGPLAACGYSFGAVVALAATADAPGVERWILVAPPPSLLPAGSRPPREGRTLVAVGEGDQIAPARELAAWAEALSSTQCVVIPEADHFFVSGLRELGGEVAAWLVSGDEGSAGALRP